MGHSENCPEREAHGITGLPKEDRKISNKQLKTASKVTRKTTNKTQSK